MPTSKLGAERNTSSRKYKYSKIGTVMDTLVHPRTRNILS